MAKISHVEFGASLVICYLSIIISSSRRRCRPSGSGSASTSRLVVMVVVVVVVVWFRRFCYDDSRRGRNRGWGGSFRITQFDLCLFSNRAGGRGEMLK